MMGIQFMAYGYSRRDGGDIVQIKSGYVEEASKKDDRPPVSAFPPEFCRRFYFQNIKR